jgi:hypothetical protein
MKNKTTLLMLLAFCALTCGIWSCNLFQESGEEQENPQNTNIYRDLRNDYSVKIPQGWEVAFSTRNPVSNLVYVYPKTGSHRKPPFARITCQKVSKDAALSDLVKQRREQLSKEFLWAAFKVDDFYYAHDDVENDGVLITFMIEMNTYLEYNIKRDSTLYIIRCVSPTNDLALNQIVFENIVANFR